MIKILFICHGNICRSPMAEFIMKKLIADPWYYGNFERTYQEIEAGCKGLLEYINTEELI